MRFSFGSRGRIGSIGDPMFPSSFSRLAGWAIAKQEIQLYEENS
jgi:hypothetical protein